MNDDRDTRAERTVDRATRALREAPVPPGPPAETVQAVLDAEPPGFKRVRRGAIKERIFHMNRIAKIAATLIVVAGAAGLLAWLTVGPGPTAWAAMQDKIRAARTLTCTLTMAQEGKPPMVAKMFFKEGGLIRQEFTKPQRAINIIDIESGKMLVLMPKQKKAIQIDMSALPENMRNQDEDKDFLLGTLKELVEESETPLGEKEIAGKQAKGYKVEQDGQVFAVWVDADTGDPLQIDIEMFGGTMSIGFSDFEIDKPLDDGLFSLEVPKGYEVLRKMKLTQATAENMAELLEIWVKANGGRFPDRLTPQQMVTDLKKAGPAPSEDVAFKMGELAAGAFVLLANAERDPRYVGKGVKLGDKDKAVFWFRPAKSETYKVIHGDLSIRDVAEADLPEVPETPDAKDVEADPPAED